MQLEREVLVPHALRLVVAVAVYQVRRVNDHAHAALVHQNERLRGSTHEVGLASANGHALARLPPGGAARHRIPWSGACHRGWGAAARAASRRRRRRTVWPRPPAGELRPGLARRARASRSARTRVQGKPTAATASRSCSWRPARAQCRAPPPGPSALARAEPRSRSLGARARAAARRGSCTSAADRRRLRPPRQSTPRSLGCASRAAAHPTAPARRH
eukprot:scaffold2809_cov373-Prasinococcus_capsulatus_cf.AAC.9